MATIPDGFISLIVAGDLYPFPPRSRPWLDEAGWVRMCWLDAGCITARIQPGPKCGSQSGRRGVVMIPDDFRVADDLYPTPPAVAGWLRLCWLHPGCIIVRTWLYPGCITIMQPASSQPLPSLKMIKNTFQNQTNYQGPFTYLRTHILEQYTRSSRNLISDLNRWTVR